MTADGMVSIRRPIRRANRWVKWRTSGGMSSERSRSGGSRAGTRSGGSRGRCGSGRRRPSQPGRGCGRHQAHVHVDRLGAAQALELLFLQYAEQFGLQLWRDVADLVEKQRPPVRELETADLLADGAGKGALLVAEQLALQEPRGDGRAVELDEGALAARAQVVKGTGDEFLARACFATNEHRGAGGGDGLDLLEDPGWASLRPTKSSKLCSVRASSSR